MLGTLAFSTAATMVLASARLMASGFSQQIILPASAAATTTSWCMMLGTQTSTRSTSERVTALRQSVSIDS